jgi:hypothetical protein
VTDKEMRATLKKINRQRTRARRSRKLPDRVLVQLVNDAIWAVRTRTN